VATAQLARIQTLRMPLAMFCYGVLVWVPSVYTIFAQYLAHHPIDLSPLATVGI